MKSKQQRDQEARQTMGVAVLYLSDDGEQNALMFGHDETIEAAHRGDPKAKRLALTLALAGHPPMHPDGSPNMHVLTAKQAVRCSWAQYEHALFKTGWGPLFQKAPAVALSDLPFMGLEPDEPRRAVCFTYAGQVWWVSAEEGQDPGRCTASRYVDDHARLDRRVASRIAALLEQNKDVTNVQVVPA